MPRPSRINVFCYLAIGLLGVYISAYQGVISEISRDFTISRSLTGFIISLHFIGAAAAPPVFGEIADRIGKKSAVMAAGIFYILGLGMVYLSKGLFAAAAGIFFIGCGFGVIESMLSGVLADFNRTSTNRVISISQMFFGVGAIAGPILAVAMTALTGNWRSSFMLVAIALALFLVYMARLDFRVDGSSLPSGDAEKPELITVKLLKDGIFLLLCASIFIYVGIEEGVAFWTTSYFTGSYGSAEIGSYALSCYWGIMIPGRFIGSIFANRVKLLMYSGLSIAIVSVLLVLFSNNIALDFCGFAGIGLGLSVIWPLLMSAAAGRYPRYTGTAMGLMMAFSALGGITIPFVIGFISEFSGIDGAFGIFPLLAAVIFLIQSRCLARQHEYKV